MSLGLSPTVHPSAPAPFAAPGRKRGRRKSRATAGHMRTREATEHAPRALIVEDDQLIVWDLSDRVQELGLEVCGAAPTAAEAVRLAEEMQPDIILMDIHLRGEGDGIEAAETILSRRKVPIIFVTAFGDSATMKRIGRIDAAGHLTKPVQTNRLKSAITAALNRNR